MSIYGLGNVTASTRAIAEDILDYLERRGTPLPKHPDTGTQVVWGMGSSSEHATGRALDFMVTANPRIGDVIADYAWANRSRFGLKHVIWKQRIRSTEVAPGQWRKMSDRGSPTENHMDHPHLYFSGKDVKAPSREWAPTGNLSVKQIQGKLGLTQDGKYGSWTKKKVTEIQRALGVTADGLWGRTTEEAYMELEDLIKDVWSDLKGARTDIRRKIGWTDKFEMSQPTADSIGWGKRKNKTMSYGGYIQTTMRLSADAAQGITHTKTELARIADEMEELVKDQAGD